MTKQYTGQVILCVLQLESIVQITCCGSSDRCLFTHTRMVEVGQKSHKPKKRSRTARADSSDDDNGYLEARTSTLSADRQRNITTIPTGVARVAMERPRMPYVPAPPIDDLLETVPLPQPSQKQRRYKNSVSYL